MNLLHELVKQTTIYQKLQRDLSMTNNEYEKLICKYEELCNSTSQKNELIKNNKKYARKIYKLTKDKEIRNLCNKILKGEN
jgi:uridine kinase